MALSLLVKNPIIISPTCQEFMGYRFYKCGPYFSRETENGGRIQLHRAVWETFKMEFLDDDMCIHHIDGDKSNNAIENLEAMTRADHMRLHSTVEMREAARKRMPKVIEAAKAWHGSEEGLKWHAEHAQRSLMKALVTQNLVCSNCGSNYTVTATKTRAFGNEFKYCSNKCKSAGYRKRRKDGNTDAVHMETATKKCCENCGIDYWTNRPRSAKYCSVKCLNYASRNRRKK